MSEARKIVILPGDGIGTEIVAEGRRVLEHVNAAHDLGLVLEEHVFGGAAWDETGDPLPGETLEACRGAAAILLGAIGGPTYDAAPRELRPERGLLRLRKELGLFANLRPALLYPELADASSLKPELVEGLDLMILRELTGGIYFGEPRGIEVREPMNLGGVVGGQGVGQLGKAPAGGAERYGFNTMVYAESEIRRIAVRGFEIARQRGGRLCSVDKANVLEVSELWREVVTAVGEGYPDVELSHMYVDNAAMQLVRAPKQFDVIVTSNLFGDILSDAAAMLTGSIGMLPSASLDAAGGGLYEPVHGSAPDIAGQGVANPLATILSAAMMLRYTLDEAAAADAIERAVGRVLADGVRSADIGGGADAVGTEAMGDAVMAALEVETARGERT